MNQEIEKELAEIKEILCELRDAIMAQKEHPAESPVEYSTQAIASELLWTLGISARYTGHQYIIDAIEVLLDNPAAEMTKHVYPEVAKKNHVAWSNVERSIRYCVPCARPDMMQKYFGMLLSEDGRIRNSAFLKRLAELVEVEMISKGECTV